MLSVLPVEGPAESGTRPSQRPQPVTVSPVRHNGSHQPVAAVRGFVGQDPGVPIFETVAEEYDRARPGYPPRVYEALGALEGLTVLDVGAGTGIATRELLLRGASVVAIDAGS